MKFICLGYGDESHWDAMSKREQDAMIDECFSYDEELLTSGHWVDGGQALQSTRTSKTLRWKSGEVVITDGPFAETKEQLGGIGVLEARDINHAVEILSKHPSLRYGVSTEIRPVDEEVLQRNLALDAKCPSDSAVMPNISTQAKEFACLGYIEDAAWDTSLKGQMEAMIAECVAFDEACRRAGQWRSGMALQGAVTAKTLRSINGKVVVTDGPYVETKEWLGGVVVLALKDTNHAIELLSTHPGLRFGVSIEVRPTDDELNARWETRHHRIQKASR